MPDSPTLSVVIDRQLSRLYEAYTVDEFCRHILPVIIGTLAKDKVAKVRQASVEVVSFSLFLTAVILSQTVAWRFGLVVTCWPQSS